MLIWTGIIGRQGPLFNASASYMKITGDLSPLGREVVGEQAGDVLFEEGG
jgi:hypothetical protein